MQIDKCKTEAYARTRESCVNLFSPPPGSKLQYFFRMFFLDHNCMLHNTTAGLSVPDRWFEDVKFSRGGGGGGGGSDIRQGDSNCCGGGVHHLDYRDNPFIIWQCVTWVCSDLYSDVIVRSGCARAVHTRMMLLPFFPPYFSYCLNEDIAILSVPAIWSIGGITTASQKANIVV